MNHFLKRVSYSLLLVAALAVSACDGKEPLVDTVVQEQPEQSVATVNEEPVGEYILEIFEDSKGILWIGTLQKGVARWDGSALSYITTADGLAGNEVIDIQEDSDGSLWFSSHSGITKYDGTTFYRYWNNEGLSGMGGQLLIANDGTIWAATNNGAFTFDGKNFIPFDLPVPKIKEQYYTWELGKVWNMFEDSKGNIWFGRDGYGACMYDGTDFTLFTKKEGLCSNTVVGFNEDNEGNIWLGSIKSDFPEYVKEGGLNRFDGKKMHAFPDIDGLHESDIYGIRKDKQGNIYVGAMDFGVYRYTNGTFTLFNNVVPSNQLKKFSLSSFLEDSNGTLWCGFSGGLFRFDGTQFIHTSTNGPWQ